MQTDVKIPLPVCRAVYERERSYRMMTNLSFTDNASDVLLLEST